MATQTELAPPSVKSYMATPETQQKCEFHNPNVKYMLTCIVQYSEIPSLNFSQYDVPGGKEKLIAQMKEAVEDTG
jgi:hypothetical protein